MNEIKQDAIGELSQWLDKSHQLHMRYNFLFSKERGLSFAQMITLHHIHHCRHCSVGDISRFLSISPPAVSQLVDKLVHMELVDRKENPGDRRQKSHYLTPKGEALLAEKHQYGHKWIEDFIHHIPEDELESILNSISSLNAHLKEFLQEKENS